VFHELNQEADISTIINKWMPIPLKHCIHVLQELDQEADILVKKHYHEQRTASLQH